MHLCTHARLGLAWTADDLISIEWPYSVLSVVAISGTTPSPLLGRLKFAAFMFWMYTTLKAQKFKRYNCSEPELSLFYTIVLAFSYLWSPQDTNDNPTKPYHLTIGFSLICSFQRICLFHLSAKTDPHAKTKNHVDIGGSILHSCHLILKVSLKNVALEFHEH